MDDRQSRVDEILDGGVNSIEELHELEVLSARELLENAGMDGKMAERIAQPGILTSGRLEAMMKRNKAPK